MACMTQALEEQIAHLTRTVEELSDVVAKQDAEMRRLTGIVDLLAQRARDREADGGGGVILGDERPPHYYRPSRGWLSRPLPPSTRLQGSSMRL